MANYYSDDEDSDDGWLETKKRGRDDDRISADREKALLARRKKTSRPNNNNNNNNKKKPAVVNKKQKAVQKKRRQRLSEDEDNDDESFIEESSDDDADEEKEWEEEEEDSDESDDGDDKCYDSDEESDTFFEAYKPRTSVAGNGFSRGRNSKTKTKSPHFSKQAKKKRSSLSSSESSDDESDDDVLMQATAKPFRPRRVEQPIILNIDDTEDEAEALHDDGDSSGDDPGWEKPTTSRNNKRVNKAPPSKSTNKPLRKAVTTSNDEDSNEEDKDDDESVVSVSMLGKTKPAAMAPNKQPMSPYRVGRSDSLMDLDDSPTPFKPRMNNPNKKKRKHIFSDDDDDDNAVSDVESESEALAIALAMSESTKELEETKQASQNQDAILLDTEDEEEDDDDGAEEEQEEFEDPEAREAGSILETANALSKEILTTMCLWVNGDDYKQEPGSNKTSIPTGMIVDGALALSTASALSDGRLASSKNSQTWISNETMKEVCPNIVLADYQLIGVNWLALMHSMKCEVKGSKKKYSHVNGVLADEMGLGKTIQTIAFLCWLKHVASGSKGGLTKDPLEIASDDDSASLPSEPSHPHLIVAPASVISSWEREFQRFAPQMNVFKYHGSQEQREVMKEELRNYLPGARRLPGMKPLDAIIVSYPYFSTENGSDRSFLRKFKFNYLVCDEAHILKNAQGMRYRNLDKNSSLRRLLLSGTPVQNSPKELLALLCFLMPLFSSSRAQSYEEKDGGESMLRHFVELEKKETSTDESAYRKLKQLFAPFVLRRLKMDVLSQLVPPKIQSIEFVELAPEAKTCYDAIIVNHIQSKKVGAAATREHLFTQLRKASHHPLLIRSRHKTTAEKHQLAKLFHAYNAFQGGTMEQVSAELDKYNDFAIHHTALELVEQNKCRHESLLPYILKEEDLFSSAKFIRLRSLIPELLAKGHRILIFSAWTSCLDLLGCLLETLDVGFLRMDGSTPVRDRQDLVDRYQNDPSIPVFLLSTKACGLGITLTAADVCIIHDLDFNPFNDLQAQDRAHRVGQTKVVHVIKLVTKSTVDEHIYNIQEQKAKMNDAIMGSDEWKKQADKNMAEIVKAAVDDYLQSPH